VSLNRVYVEWQKVSSHRTTFLAAVAPEYCRKNWIAEGEKRNSYIPSRPDEYYSHTGDWISWVSIPLCCFRIERYIRLTVSHLCNYSLPTENTRTTSWARSLTVHRIPTKSNAIGEEISMACMWGQSCHYEVPYFSKVKNNETLRGFPWSCSPVVDVVKCLRKYFLLFQTWRLRCHFRLACADSLSQFFQFLLFFFRFGTSLKFRGLIILQLFVVVVVGDNGGEQRELEAVRRGWHGG